MSYNETIVLSLGGSLIVPKTGIDTQFISLFSKFIRDQIANKKRRFFIICGGGSTARYYIDAATGVLKKSIKDEDKDWLGIHSTRLNAHLIRTIFRDIAYPRIFKHYDKEYDIQDEPVVICSGWQPGWSTDYCAVLVAEKFAAKTIINMSNIDQVYDKDPRKFKDARPIDKIGWDDFEVLVGDKWIPGLNTPFDPIATQLAKKMNLNVIILNGKNIRNLEAAIEGKKFLGTVIAPFKIDASFYDRKYYLGDKHTSGASIFFYFTLWRAFLYSLFIKFFVRPRSVLDVGCGLGAVVYYLRKLGIEAHGLEISEYALKNALLPARKYLKYGDIRGIPFPDNSFDLVMTQNVLEHIHAEDIPKSIAECTRITRKYQLHRIYTKENTFLHRLYGTDLSKVSVFDSAWWERIWLAHQLTRVSRWLPRLPQAFETFYLLQK